MVCDSANSHPGRSEAESQDPETFEMIRNFGGLQPICNDPS